MTSVELKDQIDRFEHAVGSFVRSVSSLGEESFLVSHDGWSPRDIVAHLAGWNRHVIEGSRQIQRGELPFYDIDPGEDYSRVNAALIQRFDTRDRQLLLEQLRATARELASYLTTLDAAPWARDFGVRHGGSVVTIRGTVDELIQDYDHHRTQIEGWITDR